MFWCCYWTRLNFLRNGRLHCYLTLKKMKMKRAYGQWLYQHQHWGRGDGRKRIFWKFKKYKNICRNTITYNHAGPKVMDQSSGPKVLDHSGIFINEFPTDKHCTSWTSIFSVTLKRRMVEERESIFETRACNNNSISQSKKKKT